MFRALKNLYRGQGLDLEMKKSLDYVVLGITFGMVCMSITGGPALTGFARALGAGDFTYGVLMALPVIGGLMQIYASYILEKTRKRKTIFITFGIIQRLLWIPVALVPYILPVEAGMLRIWSVIVLITLTSITGAFMNVSFYTWMGDLIPLKIRGRYFSIRSRISTISGLIAGLVTAKVLDMIPGYPGYTFVFIIAAIFGTLDIICFIRVKDISMNVSEKQVSIITVLRTSFANASFRRYVTFWTLWGFSLNFASPFFAMYALGSLEMSFTEITITGQIASSLTTIFFITKWGRFLDRYGSKPLLYITCIISSVLPLLWIFASPNNYIPVLLFNLIGGMIWCGTDITNQSMLITNTPTENRSASIAIYFIITSIIGNALAFVAGGFFLDQLGKSNQVFLILGASLNKYELLFITTFIIRLIVVLIFLPRVNDEKSVHMSTVYKDIKNSLFNMKIFKS